LIYQEVHPLQEEVDHIQAEYEEQCYNFPSIQFLSKYITVLIRYLVVMNLKLNNFGPCMN